MSNSKGSAPSLDGVWAKIDRANTHIGALRHEIDKWVKRQPGRAVRDPDPQGLKHQFRVNFANGPPLNDWGVIVGDVFHDLRSALHHVVTQLRIAEGKGISARSEFPIFNDKASWADKRRGGLAKIKGVSPDAAKAIERLQPCFRSNRPDDDLLWILHDLNNMDKHRVIVPAATAVRSLRIELPPGGGRVVHTEGGLENGSVFVTVYSNQPTPEYDPQFDADIQISLDVSGFPELGAKLTDVREEVLRIVYQFGKFLK